MVDRECPACGGEGECVTSHRWTCHSCSGTGRIRDPEQYRRLAESEREARAGFDARLRAGEYRAMGG